MIEPRVSTEEVIIERQALEATIRCSTNESDATIVQIGQRTDTHTHTSSLSRSEEENFIKQFLAEAEGDKSGEKMV